MNSSQHTQFETHDSLDDALIDLQLGKSDWARLTPARAVGLLKEIKEALASVAEDWAIAASRAKGLPEGSRFEGEEWLSGPYAVLATCNALIDTLSGLENRRFLKRLPVRHTASSQIAVRVVPHDMWDRLISPGISAEVWMEPGLTRNELAASTAKAWSVPLEEREGRVALVLGAGNIAAIVPLDCFQKLFAEHQVVLLKLNPVNEYLKPYLDVALGPLIHCNALRIVTGDGAVGNYLTTHPAVDEIHITGAGETHDRIVWGSGLERDANKAAGTPINTRRVTSELGAVSPTIVVPGPWSAADIEFQAEHIATHKMHNSGFNCLSCQVLVVSPDWAGTEPLVSAVEQNIADVDRPAYYPGAQDRLAQLAEINGEATWLKRKSNADVLITRIPDDQPDQTFEVFGPALSIKPIAEADPEAFLIAAVAYANASLDGTLSAGILIHPKTIRQIGERRFEEIVAGLHYGSIAINSWTAAGFLLTRTPWGAFPGHKLDDIKSGIGQVHNAFMFDRAERAVVRGPWRPFPRSFLNGEWTLLPRPPWFVTHRRAPQTNRALTEFQHKRSIWKIPRIMLNALLG